MNFANHLAAIAGSVAFKLKAAEGKLCTKQCLVIIKEAIADAVTVAQGLEASPGDKRLFLEAAAATAFDSIWATIPLPMAMQWLRTAYITNRYIRPNALWGIDMFVDEAFVILNPVLTNPTVEAVVAVAENVVSSTTTVTTTAVTNTPSA